MFKWFKGLFSKPQTKYGSNGALTNYASPISFAGLTVDESSALEISVVSSCLNAIIDTVIQAPIDVYRRVSNGVEIAHDHPVQRLIIEPNQYAMTFDELIQTWLGHYLINGMGYIRVDRDNNFVPSSLLPLLPDRTYPVLKDGLFYYQTRNGSNETENLTPDSVIQIKGLGYDGLTAYSPIHQHRHELGNEKALTEFIGSQYASGLNPGTAFKHKVKQSPESKDLLKAQVNTDYAGRTNYKKNIILDNDWQFERLPSFSNEEAQFVEVRKFLTRKIAAAFKVPPHKVGDDSRTSFSSLEQENRYFYIETINPLMRKMEKALNKTLFREDEKDQYYIEFNRRQFLQADLAAQTEHFVAMLQNKVYTPNVVLEHLGMNPVPWGDQPLETPNNNAPNRKESPEGKDNK